MDCLTYLGNGVVIVDGFVGTTNDDQTFDFCRQFGLCRVIYVEEQGPEDHWSFIHFVNFSIALCQVITRHSRTTDYCVSDDDSTASKRMMICQLVRSTLEESLKILELTGDRCLT